MRLRLANQHIAGRLADSPETVVHRLGAVQAQDYLGSLWAVGLRMRSAVEAAVEQAIADRRMVRTWPMRGTLHFVAADDARWMLALLAPRVVRSAASRHRQLELDAKVFSRAEKILVRALEGGHRLTRPAMYELLNAAGITTGGSRGLHIVQQLAHQQLLVFGPREGKQPTFVLLDEWIPSTPSRTREESLAELAVRYFSSHGPATLHDFGWWSGLTIAETREAVALAGDRVMNDRFGEQMYWLGADTSAFADVNDRVYLLPPFDEYTVAYKHRDVIIDPAYTKQVNAGGGMLNAVIVIDGAVVGTWSRTVKKRDVIVALQPFKSLRKAETQAIAAAAEMYGAFLGLRASTESLR